MRQNQGDHHCFGQGRIDAADALASALTLKPAKSPSRQNINKSAASLSQVDNILTGFNAARVVSHLDRGGITSQVVARVECLK